MWPVSLREGPGWLLGFHVTWPVSLREGPGWLLEYHVTWHVSLREGPRVVARIPCHMVARIPLCAS